MDVKKLVAVSLVFLLTAAIPTNAFFNRDCKNLAKRTATNQVKYEKAWNSYQKVLGDWINAGAKYGGQKVVESRIDQVGNAQIRILDDFLANRKCLSISNPSFFASAKIEISLDMQNVAFLRWEQPFGKLLDYTKYVKK